MVFGRERRPAKPAVAADGGIMEAPAFKTFAVWCDGRRVAFTAARGDTGAEIYKTVANACGLCTADTFGLQRGGPDGARDRPHVVVSWASLEAGVEYTLTRFHPEAHPRPAPDLASSLRDLAQTATSVPLRSLPSTASVERLDPNATYGRARALRDSVGDTSAFTAVHSDNTSAEMLRRVREGGAEEAVGVNSMLLAHGEGVTLDSTLATLASCAEGEVIGSGADDGRAPATDAAAATMSDAASAPPRPHAKGRHRKQPARRTYMRPALLLAVLLVAVMGIGAWTHMAQGVVPVREGVQGAVPAGGEDEVYVDVEYDEIVLDRHDGAPPPDAELPAYWMDDAGGHFIRHAAAGGGTADVALPEGIVVLEDGVGTQVERLPNGEVVLLVEAQDDT
eukprot:TRINITY_DN28290_c0_g1_i1.p1 TRINITY_DN28290_c0_g1~~TRINITY_DN28290_c0_g1_i1.p1  ORF type:complete len:411 (+),score=83.60 TRINITY_DN28290_c0_g1_i1:53-1234(+)